MRTGGKITLVGVCVIDILGRPIETLPTGQGSHPLEEIKATVAGTAAGTSIDLARLGADVTVVGARGNDLLGDLMEEGLRREGVTPILSRKQGVQTSATILPIHPDGSRPAWHVPAANRELGPEDVPADALRDRDIVHYAGLTALPGLDGELGAAMLATARDNGAFTTADCLGIKRADTDHLLEAMLPEVDLFMPNRAEALALTGETDVFSAARRLRCLGAASVIVTCDSAGCVIADADGERTRPAFVAPVVDSTGCGDAFSAGVMVSLQAGKSLDDAATFGLAAAALILGKLGSVDGLRSYDETIAWMENAETSTETLGVN
ncbi:MAG TPA: PfkB family carbohydrate kinase [Solirubrobacterales bacterium]|nr:PfkB family carbohydrate kinase [Solirubrobacterales bacterium]